jgi:O-antigen/teichoic acid export membrane protein
MTQGLDDSLLKITKGAGIAFLGSLVGLLFAFFTRLLVARYGTESEYGVFSLALAVLNIGVIVAALGLHIGASRSIGYARAKNDSQKVQGLVSASIWFALVASLVLGAILFLTSNIIAEGIFHEPTLGLPLEIFAAAIPFLTLIYIFISIFMGFDDVKPAVYFRDILINLFFLLLLLGVTFFVLPFHCVFYVYLISLGTSCFLLITYTVKRLPSPIKISNMALIKPVTRELLIFSLPLLGVAILGLIIGWADTLMLGLFKTSEEVGLYNVASPLANFISAPLVAMALIYMPVTSGLYVQGLIPEIRRNFSILTKWLCSATLPLFLVMFLFPETVLSFLFGSNYALSANALRILSLGFIISNLLGPNRVTLIVMGKSQFTMWATLATAVLNIGLNIVLIPPLGIEGAAIAATVALVSINLIVFWKIYSLERIQPLSKNLIKPTLVSLALIFLIQFIFGNFVTVTWWMLPLILILYYGVYGLAVLFTKSFDKEDIAMLLTIEKTVGVDLSSIKAILRRFL